MLTEENENCARILVRRKGGKLQIIEFNPYVTELINNYLKVRKETECEKLFVLCMFRKANLGVKY